MASLTPERIAEMRAKVEDVGRLWAQDSRDLLAAVERAADVEGISRIVARANTLLPIDWHLFEYEGRALSAWLLGGE